MDGRSGCWSQCGQPRPPQSRTVAGSCHRRCARGTPSAERRRWLWRTADAAEVLAIVDVTISKAKTTSFVGMTGPKLDIAVVQPLSEDDLRTAAACQPPKPATLAETLRHRRDERRSR